LVLTKQVIEEADMGNELGEEECEIEFGAWVDVEAGAKMHST
jgi:hypothetical protein